MIQPLRLLDRFSLKSLLDEAFPGIWSMESVEALLKHPCASHWGFWQAEDLVAAVVTYHVADTLDIITVATQATHRRQGLQVQLFQKLMEIPDIAHISLEVDVSNAGAIRLYEKLGFKIVNIRKQYYEQERDAFLMVWRAEKDARGLFANPQYA